MILLLPSDESGNPHLNTVLKVGASIVKMDKNKLKAIMLLGMDNDAIVVISNLTCLIKSFN